MIRPRVAALARPFVVVAVVAAVAWCIVALGSVTAPAQEPQPQGQERPQLPRFRGGANLVRVDVYPTADGVPVKDLTIDDFEVSEDGDDDERAHEGAWTDHGVTRIPV